MGSRFSWATRDCLRGLPPFALITSIMALQFVADLPTLFADLTHSLVPGGHLIFAVHNPAFFQGEVLRFANGVEVPIFIRSAVDYHAVAEPAGLEPLLETYPPFTPEFLGALSLVRRQSRAGIPDPRLSTPRCWRADGGFLNSDREPIETLSVRGHLLSSGPDHAA